ncbi:MAG: hypothetical protein ACRCXB_31255 [Aeromonadaceae bacterium]
MNNVKWCDALKAGNKDFERNDDPVCPHCGNECNIDECELWNLYEESVHSVSCPHCDMDFNVSSHARWSFSTDEQEDES